jgi:type 1 glutamine amidotransferase
MRLDASKLDLNNPRVHRKDLDFAVTWAKMYGKGRVYYSTLGHAEQNWDDPRMQKMYVEAIKWAMGLTNADVTPRSVTVESGKTESVMAPRQHKGCSFANIGREVENGCGD